MKKWWLVGAVALGLWTTLGVSAQVFRANFGEATATCIDTGQGCNDLYRMNQNVMSTNTPTFLGAIFLANTYIQKDAIGTDQTDGITLTNTTAAAAGAQQYGPQICTSGNGWKTNATAESQPVEFCEQVQTVQGAAAPTGNLVFTPYVNGAAGNAVSITSTGSVVVSNTLAATHIATTGAQTYGAAVTATVDGATTFALTSSFMNLACTGAETVTTITGGSAGMVLILSNQDTDCTLTDDETPTAANGLALTGASNDTGAVQKFMWFIHDGNAWMQIAESDN